MPGPLDELPDFAEEEIQKSFPDGFTIPGEARGLAAYALIGFPKASPLDALLVEKRITRAERDEVIKFAVRKLEFLLGFRKKNPKAYRNLALLLAHAQLKERKWHKL
jgi:hypothetical protein